MNRPTPGPTASDLPGEGRSTTLWAEALVVVALAFLLRLLHLDSPPHFDEMYHILAARGWLETGTFTLAEGVYTRASLFTLLVAGSFAVFGESLAASRVPALIFGVVWVLVVFLWTRRHAGRAAGLLTGVLFAVDPGAINLSQLSRFYTLHGLAFWILAISVFSLSQRRFDRSSIPLIGVALVAWVLALYLQLTTFIGGLALGVWFVFRVGPVAFREARSDLRVRALALGVVALGVGLVALLFLSGAAFELLARYQTSPMWSAGRRDNVLWYHVLFNERFAGFWALFPLATLVAIRRFQAPALFCAVLFGVALLLHSGAGSKAERYVYYAMPGFFILWAMAITTLLPAFLRGIDGWIRSVTPLPGARALALALITGGILFAIYSTPVNYMARRMIVPDEARPFEEPDWLAAAPMLRGVADSVDVVVSGSLPKAIFFLGRGDVALGVTELAELSPGDRTPEEFRLDHRTGRPSISKSESLVQLMASHPSGLVIVERQQWRRDALVTPEVADFLMDRMVALDLPESSDLLAFRWPSPPDEGE